jgi:RNA polymerase sigma factor (sigma-70 family)
MAEISDTARESTELRLWGEPLSPPEVAAWFVREVLPLEGILMQFLQHNWRNKSDITDLRQEVYMRVCESARQRLPDHTKRFVLTTARNLLLNRLRHEHVVPIEAVADVDALGMAIDAPGPDQIAMARDELRRLQMALDRLPPRCREAMLLAHVEGLSGQEIAARMNVAQATVSEHLANGIRGLTDTVFGDRGRKS